jgi:hypothetical protein
MVSKSNTLWIHGTYESMTNFHGHKQYIVDLCDNYKVASVAMNNTQWIHVKEYHSHEEIHSGYVYKDQ